MKQIGTLILLLLGVATAKGQVPEEHWDTYMVRMGKMPASVMVDMAAKETSPDPRYPYLVITGPKTRNCNTLGLPEKDEVTILEDILDATTNFITGLTPRRLVGTMTRNCQRVNYYYVRDTSGIRTALHRMYSRSFKDYTYVLGMKPDPGWTTYKNSLYPDEETRNWMENEKKVTQLLQKGDSLNAPHKFRYSLLFRTQGDCDSFMAFTKDKGYQAYVVKTANGYTPFELLLTTRARLNLEEINTRSFELKSEARKRDGFYNGWEIE